MAAACSYISKEELEQALREKGLLDGRDMNEIVSEVDADNVINECIHSLLMVDAWMRACVGQMMV